MKRIGNPLSAYFDNPDAQLREALRDTVIDQRVKCAHHGELEFAKAGFVEKEIVRRDAAVRRMDADRHVELRGGLIHRKKIRFTEPPVRLQTSQVHATGTVLFAELQFFEDMLHI